MNDMSFERKTVILIFSTHVRRCSQWIVV